MRTARFAELTGAEVYGLCRLRVDVFVVEQECPYPELDGRDVEPGTVHLWFEDGEGGVAATIRVLDDGGTRAIGRVATAAAHRGEGLAARLREAGISLCDGVPITLGAQAHLEGWYARFGFVRSGPGYVEDGIPHVPMRREPAAWDPPASPWRPRPEARREPASGEEDGALLQTARRRRRRRSRSESPPQMPKRSSLASAYSRHSALTSQPVQIFLASRVEPPFSGKNASGSVSAHSARSCQDCTSASRPMLHRPAKPWAWPVAPRSRSEAFT